MKNTVNTFCHKIALLLLIATITSCNKWIVLPEYSGSWQSEKQKVTVRTEPNKGVFEFTSDSVALSLIIHEDKTVDGTLGNTSFKGVTLKKNGGNPEKTGIIYRVKCGHVGKIFSNDPLSEKEVQLWLCPIEKGAMEAELRYTEGMAYFPMGFFPLSKLEDSKQF